MFGELDKILIKIYLLKDYWPTKLTNVFSQRLKRLFTHSYLVGLVAFNDFNVNEVDTLFKLKTPTITLLSDVIM